MTITNDGKIVTYVCPVCSGMTRGLVNGMCNRCDLEREYRSAVDKLNRSTDRECWGNDVHNSFMRAVAADLKRKAD
jgi:hypothetical protein